MYIYNLEMLGCTSDWHNLGTYATKRQAISAMAHLCKEHHSLAYRVVCMKKYGAMYLDEYIIEESGNIITI